MSYIVFGLLSALFAALVTITGKIALKGVDSTILAGARAFFITVFIGVYVLFNMDQFKQYIHMPRSRELIALLFSALFGALSWAFYFKALQKAPNVKIVQALDRLSIVFVTILAFVVLRESLTFWHILGAVLIVVGTILIGGIWPG